MKNTKLTFTSFLLRELNKRQKKNPAYSLRAFSRDLDIASSRLSEIISGKAGISEQRALQLSEKLNLSSSEKEMFVNLALAKHSRSALGKQLAEQKISQYIDFKDSLREDQLTVISDWHHFAIIEALGLKNLEHTATAFAKRLNIPAEVASLALERLEKIGLITRENDRWIPTTQDRASSRDIPSEALRKSQRQIIEKATKSIDEQHVNRRDISSVVFAMDKDQVPTVKERIRQFRRELMKEFEVTENKNSVYCMAVQFFEMTEEPNDF